jgi:alkylated DNA repair dioxygenase AlkB
MKCVQFGGAVGKEWGMTVAQSPMGKGADGVVTLIEFKGRPVLKMYPKFLSEDEADVMYGQLDESCPWTVSKVKIVGRELNECRETCLLAKDPSLSYFYSGIKRNVEPMNTGATSFLEKMRSEGLLSLEHVKEPNLFLLNRYSPQQYICEHSDDERNIDQTQSIWSLSLGHTRVLVIREKRAKFNQLNKKKGIDKKRTWKMEIRMPHGSLLEFCPGMQDWFSHEVIKPRKKLREDAALTHHSKFKSRINLTARVFNEESHRQTKSTTSTSSNSSVKVVQT